MVNAQLFWKALAAQAAAVLVLFAVLVALPFPEDFFERWGWLTGPVAWFGCALLTARILGLPERLVLFSAAVGGAAGAIVFLLVGHGAGLAAALLVFGAACGAGQRSAPPVAAAD